MDRHAFFYFAYGSNMLRERLVARCPSARFVGVAELTGAFDLVLCKRSVDGSGKAALVTSEDGMPLAQIVGVVYQVDQDDRPRLDHVEGDGYRPGVVSVRDIKTGRERDVRTYLADPDALYPGLQPYDWYVALMVAGAQQNNLPEAYISALAQLGSQTDPIQTRDRRVEALACLEAAGFPFSSG